MVITFKAVLKLKLLMMMKVILNADDDNADDCDDD